MGDVQVQRSLKLSPCHIRLKLCEILFAVQNTVVLSYHCIASIPLSLARLHQGWILQCLRTLSPHSFALTSTSLKDALPDYTNHRCLRFLLSKPNIPQRVTQYPKLQVHNIPRNPVLSIRSRIHLHNLLAAPAFWLETKPPRYFGPHCMPSLLASGSGSEYLLGVWGMHCERR